MANEDLQLEIELLRTQLDEIKRDSKTEPAKTSVDNEEQAVEEAESESASTETPASEDINAEDIVSQFKELLESIDQDIKDTKPSTLLIVFALGVLVGRL
jgi:hypothetical protein